MTDKIWAMAPAGVVTELHTLPEAWVPGVDIFAPDIAKTMFDITAVAGIAVGWIKTNGVFEAPASTPVALTVDQLIGLASTKQNNILAKTLWTVNVGTVDAPINLTTYLDDSGQASMMKLILWATQNASVAGATEAYANVDSTGFEITPAQASAMGFAAGAIVSQSYATYIAVAGQIRSGAITTSAQIDAAAWPTPST